MRKPSSAYAGGTRTRIYSGGISVTPGRWYGAQTRDGYAQKLIAISKEMFLPTTADFLREALAMEFEPISYQDKPRPGWIVVARYFKCEQCGRNCQPSVKVRGGAYKVMYICRSEWRKAYRRLLRWRYINRCLTCHPHHYLGMI